MEAPAPLFAVLHDLSEALDGGNDLSAILAVLSDDLRASTTHYLGLELTVILADETVTIADVAPGQVAARLSLTLFRSGDGSAEEPDAPSRITFYSGSPRAFDTLAADARVAFSPHGRIEVDDDHISTPPDAESQQRTLANRSAVNQAIGALIEAGFLPVHAQDELRRRADRDDVTVVEAAHQVLRSLHL